MKKYIAVLLVLVLVSTTALADEILFRGIPWGTSVLEFEKQIGCEIGYTELRLPHWSSYSPTSSIDKGTYTIGYDVTAGFGDTLFQVAGYDLDFIFAYFYYGVEDGKINRNPEASEFYLSEYIFDVEDIEGAYSDLKEKMTSLYGEGTEEKGKTSEYYATVWDGDNNTAVRLLVRSNYPYDGSSIRLVYGKTDSDEHVKYLEELVQQERIMQERNNRSDSKDGL